MWKKITNIHSGLVCVCILVVQGSTLETDQRDKWGTIKTYGKVKC